MAANHFLLSVIFCIIVSIYHDTCVADDLINNPILTDEFKVVSGDRFIRSPQKIVVRKRIIRRELGDLPFNELKGQNRAEFRAKREPEIETEKIRNFDEFIENVRTVQSTQQNPRSSRIVPSRAFRLINKDKIEKLKSKPFSQKRRKFILTKPKNNFDKIKVRENKRRKEKQRQVHTFPTKNFENIKIKKEKFDLKTKNIHSVIKPINQKLSSENTENALNKFNNFNRRDDKTVSENDFLIPQQNTIHQTRVQIHNNIPRPRRILITEDIEPQPKFSSFKNKNKIRPKQFNDHFKLINVPIKHFNNKNIRIGDEIINKNSLNLGQQSATKPKFKTKRGRKLRKGRKKIKSKNKKNPKFNRIQLRNDFESRDKTTQNLGHFELENFSQGFNLQNKIPGADKFNQGTGTEKQNFKQSNFVNNFTENQPKNFAQNDDLRSETNKFTKQSFEPKEAADEIKNENFANFRNNNLKTAKSSAHVQIEDQPFIRKNEDEIFQTQSSERNFQTQRIHSNFQTQPKNHNSQAQDIQSNFRIKQEKLHPIPKFRSRQNQKKFQLSDYEDVLNHIDEYDDYSQFEDPSIFDQFSYGYKVEEKTSGNFQTRSERRNGKQIVGSYEVALPDGRIQTVTYVADKNGFKADVSYRKSDKFLVQENKQEKISRHRSSTKVDTRQSDKFHLANKKRVSKNLVNNNDIFPNSVHKNNIITNSINNNIHNFHNGDFKLLDEFEENEKTPNDINDALTNFQNINTAKNVDTLFLNGGQFEDTLIHNKQQRVETERHEQRFHENIFNSKNERFDDNNEFSRQNERFDNNEFSRQNERFDDNNEFNRQNERFIDNNEFNRQNERFNKNDDFSRQNQRFKINEFNGEHRGLNNNFNIIENKRIHPVFNNDDPAFSFTDKKEFISQDKNSQNNKKHLFDRDSRIKPRQKALKSSFNDENIFRESSSNFNDIQLKDVDETIKRSEFIKRNKKPVPRPISSITRRPTASVPKNPFATTNKKEKHKPVKPSPKKIISRSINKEIAESTLFRNNNLGNEVFKENKIFPTKLGLNHFKNRVNNKHRPENKEKNQFNRQRKPVRILREKKLLAPNHQKMLQIFSLNENETKNLPKMSSATITRMKPLRIFNIPARSHRKGDETVNHEIITAANNFFRNTKSKKFLKDSEKLTPEFSNQNFQTSSIDNDFSKLFTNDFFNQNLHLKDRRQENDQTFSKKLKKDKFIFNSPQTSLPEATTKSQKQPWLVKTKTTVLLKTNRNKTIAIPLLLPFDELMFRNKKINLEENEKNDNSFRRQNLKTRRVRHENKNSFQQIADKIIHNQYQNQINFPQHKTGFSTKNKPPNLSKKESGNFKSIFPPPSNLQLNEADIYPEPTVKL